MILALATLAVFLGCLAALAVPLLRRAGAPRAADGDLAAEAPARALLDEREAALDALHELDFDFATGKLAEADYQALRAGYERRALALLKATDPSPPPMVAAAPVSYRHGAIADRPPVHRNGPVGVARPRSSTAEAGSARGRRTALAAAAVGALFVGGVAAVYLAGNRGQAEQHPVATLEGAGPRALALSPADGRRAHLAAASGLWTSGDAGSTWQVVPALDGPVRAIAVSPSRPTRLYAATPGAVAVSDDGGRNWTVLPLALPAPEQQPARLPDLRGLAIDPANAERVWMALDGLGIFRSDDAARSWVRTAGEEPPNATAVAAVGAREGAGGPGAPLLYLASATDGVLASADEGRSWGPASGALSGALPTRRVSSLVFDADSGDTATLPDGREVRGTLYAGTEQGVFRSVDRGQSWARLALAVPVAAVAAGGSAEAGLLLAADREGAVYRSRNRGVSWDGR